MQSFVYAAELGAEPEGGFTVTFPDVPEAIGAGDDETEALESARGALGEALLTYMELGRDLPLPSADRSDRASVAVPAKVAAKLAVWGAWRASGLSEADFARRVGVSDSDARRLLDPDGAAGLAELEAALAAFGRHLVVGVSDAA